MDRIIENAIVIHMHEHVGLGEIGKVGFNAFLKHESHRNVPTTMKTAV